LQRVEGSRGKLVLQLVRTALPRAKPSLRLVWAPSFVGAVAQFERTLGSRRAPLFLISRRGAWAISRALSTRHAIKEQRPREDCSD